MKTQRPQRFQRDDAPRAYPTNWSWLKKGEPKDLCTRRTASFAGIQITEESDEERDAEVEK
jgi:hypothetical protein